MKLFQYFHRYSGFLGLIQIDLGCYSSKIYSKCLFTFKYNRDIKKIKTEPKLMKHPLYSKNVESFHKRTLFCLVTQLIVSYAKHLCNNKLFIMNTGVTLSCLIKHANIDILTI